MECSIPSELEESVRELLGRKAATSYRRLVRLDVKADKQEQRILVLTDYRLYILSAKSPAKIEHNVHYLDITCLESKKPTQIVVATSEHRKLSMSLTEKDAEGAIRFITAELRRSFPTATLTEMMKVDIEPAERARSLTLQPRESMLRDVGPCGGFSLMYEAICDYYHQQYLEEVAWDVDTIYQSQDSKELNLSDFDHLGIKHLVPIIGTLQYDSWFTSLNANNVRLTTEAVNEVLRVMRKNTHLEELHLRNVGAKWEFAHKLAMALLHNNNSQLIVLDLSENPIEDRGMNHLCSPLRTLQKGLKHLNLARTGITAKGVNRLADSLCANRGVTSSLTHMDLSDNALRGEDITNLYNFWAQPNVLSTIRLSGTECALENLFGALLPGCCRHLTHLDLSHNVFSHRRTKDPVVPPAWKQFFATAEALKVVNLSDTRLTAEALKNVVLGLASNLRLQEVELDVSSNNLRAAGADILQMALPETRNISCLNISDNAFDNDMMGICSKLTQCLSIRRLHIGRNFNNVKPKYMPQVMDSLVQMIQDEESTIESISLADSRLKNDTTLIINALGSNSTLTEIDLSGNLMGDVGARMLAKALQINTKLHTIYWDRNGTTALGLSDIAHGLSKNHSVKKMPSPINDAAVALRLSGDRTEQALQKIEGVLKRNHSPRKLASDQGYRLHQGFLISSSQQMLDRLVVQVKEHITTLEKGSRNLTEDAKTDLRNATRLVSDANATKQVLPKLQQVALQVETDGNLIDTKLSSVTQDLQTATQRQLKRTMADMMKCMEQQCPTIMEDDDFTQTLQASSAEKSALPPNFTKTLLIDHVGADIMNKVSELNLAVASHISDRLIDGVLDSLDACHKKLTNHINSADSLTSPLSPLQESKKPPRPENPPSLDKGRAGSNIEDDVFDEVAAQSTIKRKSLYSRRLRPQSVIDAADVKKALKMTEIDISGGGGGRLAEEEHEDKPGTGVVRDQVVDVVTPGGVVVDDLDKPARPELTSYSSAEEPHSKLDTGEGQPGTRAEGGEEWVKVEKEDLPDVDTSDDESTDTSTDEASDSEEEVKVESDPKVKTESEPKVKAESEPKVKVESDPKAKAESDPKAKAESDPKVKAEPEVKARPEPELRYKPKLRGQAVVRPDSKVASRMNAGFLANLAAGIGARKEPAPKPPQRPAGDDEEGKPADTDDASRENKDLSPIPQSPGTPKSPSLSLRSDVSDVSLPPLEELPKLEHLGKSRPRRNKTRAASRAALKADRSIEDIKEVSAGVDEFFERKDVSRELASTPEEKDTEKGDEEKKDDSKKKGWSPFSQSQPNPKGLAAGISSFFGRRDKPSSSRSPETARRLTTPEEEATRSPEPARRSINKSPTPERRRTRDKEPESPPVGASEEEGKKKDEEEPTPPWRRSATALPTLPAASTGGSTSGGASALLAEMRAKRASAINTKSDNKENKENTKEGVRSSIIPPPKENRNSIHPPASVKDRSSATPAAALKDRTSATPAAALRPTSSQGSTRPVPAPRANSPATSSDKGEKEKTDETGDSSPKSRLSFLSKPRPPPIAPKPRSKPSSPASSSAKPTIITTPRTSVYARIRESIGEKPTIPSSASTEKEDDAEEPAKPPPRMDRARRRLSVKEKVAFLDKNSNEQPAEQPLSRRASLAKADQAAPKASDPPQRARSMYGGESPLKTEDPSPSGGAVGNGRKPSDTDDGQDTPNGAAKNDGEFVLFL